MPTATLEKPAPTVVAPRRRPEPRPLRKPTPPTEQLAGDDPVTRLNRMGREGRLAAYREGGLSRHERAVWAARFPGEVPLCNGELPWIALSLADLD